MNTRLSVMFLSLFLSVFVAAQASAQSGSISGRITDAQTGLPIVSAEVTAFNMDSGSIEEAWTDTSGYYRAEHLTSGWYIVGAYREGYEGGNYPGLVTVVDGQDTPGIDFTLDPVGGAGTISGRVIEEETALPIPEASISLQGVTGIWYTDSAGYYLTDSIPDDSYEVIAFKDGFFPQSYPDTVVVLPGENTPGINFALVPLGEPGSISGTVTDVSTGEPIAGANVGALGDFGGGEAWTNSLGQYSIDSLYSGRYFLTALAEDYYMQDYPETVGVIQGQDTPGIDFALVPYGGAGEGVIAGQVEEDNSFLPIPYAMVFALSLGDNWGGAFTDSTGNYMILGLPPDDYYVYTLIFGYVSEFYDGVYTWEDATPVTPDAYDIDFYLAPADSGVGGISGAISSHGSPVEDALVYAQVSGEARGFAKSSTEGRYVITGLTPGIYTVSASKVHYQDGSYPDLIEVGSGMVAEIDIELPLMDVGDCTGDGSVDIGDVIFLLNYLFKGDVPPDPLMIGDAGCDGVVDLADVVYLINYLFRNGPQPSC
jgi:hypothetical protein